MNIIELYPKRIICDFTTDTNYKISYIPNYTTDDCTINATQLDNYNNEYMINNVTMFAFKIAHNIELEKNTICISTTASSGNNIHATYEYKYIKNRFIVSSLPNFSNCDIINSNSQRINQHKQQLILIDTNYYNNSNYITELNNLFTICYDSINECKTPTNIPNNYITIKKTIYIFYKCTTKYNIDGLVNIINKCIKHKDDNVKIILILFEVPTNNILAKCYNYIMSKGNLDNLDNYDDNNNLINTIHDNNKTLFNKSCQFFKKLLTCWKVLLLFKNCVLHYKIVAFVISSMVYVILWFRYN